MVPTNTFPSMVSKQGSSARLSITVSPARFRIIGWRARLSRKVPKQCCKKGSTNRFPSKVRKNRLLMFPGTAFQEQLGHQNFIKYRRAAASKVGSNNKIPSKVPKDRFLNQVPKQSYEKQVPEQGPNEQVWSKQAKFPRTGSQEKVPKNRLSGNAPKSRFLRIASQEQVPKQRLPRTGSQARFR